MAQGDAEIFGRHLRAALPLLLEIAALFREALGQLLDHLGDQPVGFAHGALRFIDELRLELQPLSCDRGTYDDVRNRNGKNSRNALFTAAGLPVLRAMA